MFGLAFLVIQLGLLFLNSFQSPLDILQAALGVAQAHRVDLVVGHGLLQAGFLGALGRQRALQLEDASLQVGDDQLAILDLQLDVLILLLQLLDDVQVLLRDVIVVLLHLTEGRFMINHQIVDVLVLSFLDFVQLDLHTELELFLKGDLLLLVERDERLLVLLERLLQRVQVLLVCLRLLLNLTDVRLVVSLVVLLFVLLPLAVLVLRLAVMLVFVAHDFGTVRLCLLDGLSVLVLMMLHLLEMGHDQCVMRFFLLLHLRVEVLNLCLQLFDFFPRVLIKVMDHVFLNLERITLHLGVGELLTQVLDRDLELLSTHGEELILRLWLLLLFLSLLLLSFASHVAKVYFSSVLFKTD